jgi:hypothetical protein
MSSLDRTVDRSASSLLISQADAWAARNITIAERRSPRSHGRRVSDITPTRMEARGARLQATTRDVQIGGVPAGRDASPAAWPRPRTATTANTVALVRLRDSRGAPEPCAAGGAATTQSPHQPIRPLLTGGALLRHSAPVRPSAVAWSRCATEILSAKPCAAELRTMIRRR